MTVVKGELNFITASVLSERWSALYPEVCAMFTAAVCFVFHSTARGGVPSGKGTVHAEISGVAYNKHIKVTLCLLFHKRLDLVLSMYYQYQHRDHGESVRQQR